MRRPRLFLIAILVFVLIGAAVLVFLKRRLTVPTQFNWQAHVATVAGDGSPMFRDSAQPAQSAFSDPFGVAIANDGTIYVADGGDSNRIRRILPDGSLMTFAGGVEGTGNNVFNSPSGMAIDQDGDLYVADTGNNQIRKITAQGVVSILAGNGTAGFADGPASSAQFDGPVGIAVDANGNVYVADTYNDRIRKIGVDGQVVTIAGSGRPGNVDGSSLNARFDTPCGIVVYSDGSLVVADTGNNALRKITPTGEVSTLPISFVEDSTRTWLRSPIGLARTHDGFLYVTEFDRSTVIQLSPDGRACVLAGNGPGYAEGDRREVRFNHPAGLAIDPRNGDIVVADSANYLLRKVSHAEIATQPTLDQVPRLTPDTLGEQNLKWPVDPQNSPHEVVATMGEVRGSFDSTDSRDHLHSGLDVAGAYGQVVKAIRTEKISAPLSNWGFGELSEGLRVGVISYIHMQVGRDVDNNVFKDPRFVPLMNDEGKLVRMRLRRGTLFRSGEAIGTINRMYHVHLIVGPSGGEVNPLSLSPVGFADTIAPTIEKDGIQLFDESGAQLKEQDHGRLVVHGRVTIEVDAFDRTNLNADRRRLGLYSLGYQVFKSDANSDLIPAFPLRVTIVFNRLPSDDNASKIAYAADSGITVYGSKITRFLYQVSNTIRDGHARTDSWDTQQLAKGDYVLRIVGADYSGNETHGDVPITVK